MLCLNGSDINRLEVAAYARGTDGWALQWQKSQDVGPEQYLAVLSELVTPVEIEGIVVVVGPGSATALRSSLAIANALALAQGVPLYGVQKSDNAFDSVLGAGHALPAPQVYLTPVYEHDVRITESNKDALRRRQL